MRLCDVVFRGVFIVLLIGAVPAPGAEPGAIWFPRSQIRSRNQNPPPEPTTTSAPTTEAPNQIPVELLLQLSNVENVNDFLNNFIDPSSLVSDIPSDGVIEIADRFGGVDERKSVENAKPATCTPHLEVVKLMETTDPSLYYYPICTRVERCGGCCGSSLLSCQPTRTEVVNFKVFVAQFKGGKDLAFKGNKIIPVERHLKCSCQCIIKETDCNQFQEYRENECSCVCQNIDEQQKCIKHNKKVWDSSTCTCQCKESKGCSTGFYYDQDTCSCMPTPSIRNRRGEERKKSTLKQD